MLSFDEALDRAGEIHKKRHVLLGNGFSIACRPDCFSYGRLLDQADLTGLSVDGLELFSSQGTTDFEQVVRALRIAARMAEFYESSDVDLANRFASDADLLKEILAQTLASRHPDNVGSIELEEYAAARNFLANFDHFFTLNYDLLLYWALMQDDEPVLPRNDGFSADPDDGDAPWVIWNDYRQDRQNVYFIHGGLHLYAEGATLRKITFARTGIALVDQIREQLADGTFPLIVTEGTSEEKHAAILHHGYLAKCLRSLATCQGSLFVHGHSLDPNDRHVFRGVVEGKYKALFVSLHGDADSESNRAIRARAEVLATERPERKPLLVDFYDADSAALWG